MTFTTFAAAVHANYNHMQGKPLFVVDVEDIYASYLAAFPEGTNPIFRVRTEHDCNCCKNFIRRLGVVVALNSDGTRQTVWNCADLPYPYDVVAARLHDLVMQAPIDTLFYTKETQYGSKPNFDNHSPRRWEHFHGLVGKQYQSKQPDKVRGEARSAMQVLRRGLDELTDDAFATVDDLIEQKAIYRGEEHLPAIRSFQKIRQEYAKAADRDAFVWLNYNKPAARFRNTVIGTLLVALSDGEHLEKAVKQFEAKVAPESYKRPKALITPKMIEQAVAKIDELGLTDALERRYARIEDVSVADVLFVDNEVRSKMRGGLTDLLMGSTQIKHSTPDLSKAKTIKIEDLVAMRPRRVELLLDNNHIGNFVSLTTAAHPDQPRLFKWNNDFAWMYDGELADTGMRDRVKAAGGNVKGQLRVSLGWHNSDDLDLHCNTPDRQHICYSNRRGILDVDMNAGGRHNAVDPVENMTWSHVPMDGEYRFHVHQFNERRSGGGDGFEIEIEFLGAITRLAYPHKMRQSDEIGFTLVLRKGQLVDVKRHPKMTAESLASEKWGIKTLTPVRVNTLLTSPNFWEGAGSVGNKHWFFILDGCKNPEATRGFLNEFLRGEFEPHRKVFEVLSSKTKCPPADHQLSGVGFSSTRDAEVLALVDGRPFRIHF